MGDTFERKMIFRHPIYFSHQP